MTALLSGVLAASLVGSVHCIAMCGPLAGMHGGARTVRLALVHALGRLTTYAVLGAAAGLVGRVIDLAGRLGDFQHVAAVVAGLMIVGWGLHTIAISLGSTWSERVQRPCTSVLTDDGIVLAGSRWVRRMRASG